MKMQFKVSTAEPYVGDNNEVLTEQWLKKGSGFLGSGFNFNIGENKKNP